DSRKSITQARDASQCLGREHARLLIADAYQYKVAQLETRRCLVAFGELWKTRRNYRSAVKPQLHTWDEDKSTKRHSAGDYDDDARVSHRKSQQVSYQKHRATCNVN